MLPSISHGLFLGWAMIMPIGAQNVHVISQGVRKENHVMIASICILFDSIFIVSGVLGAGDLISRYELVFNLVCMFGVAFLLYYAYESFCDAIQFYKKEKSVEGDHYSIGGGVAKVLAVTLLNPHVYLDTVVIIGSIGAGYEGDLKYGFTVGAIIASFTWFYALSFGASYFSKNLLTRNGMMFINIASGVIMLITAVTLLLRVISDISQ